MRTESKIFLAGIIFIPVGIVYGFMTKWTEWVGFLAIPLVGVMTMMVGVYLYKHSRVIGERPEDRNDGEIAEKSGVFGTFTPWSWWPLVLGASAAISFLGLAVGWWVLFIGAGLAIVAIIGWVFELSRGDWAH
ncbi:MAG: cytochrome c oxidase subunit 4 [Arthrobacter sp.]|jgi:hypothetical protein|nr:cytochrome c oxidase subunit 4 [Arthrobacter sp.]